MCIRDSYQAVFEWKFDKFDGPIDYWLVTTGSDREPGINGGLTRPREGQSPGTLNTIAVGSLEQTVRKIEQRGGKNLCAEDGNSKDRLAGLCRGSGRQRLRDYRTRYGGEIEKA